MKNKRMCFKLLSDETKNKKDRSEKDNINL